MLHDRGENYWTLFHMYVDPNWTISNIFCWRPST